MDNQLPPEVATALSAYQAMGLSKSEYFGLLQELDVKYREGGSPTIAENLMLEKLLKAHNEKVTAFNEAMQAVKDQSAREILIQKLSADNNTTGMH